MVWSHFLFFLGICWASLWDNLTSQDVVSLLLAAGCPESAPGGTLPRRRGSGEMRHRGGKEVFWFKELHFFLGDWHFPFPGCLQCTLRSDLDVKKTKLWRSCWCYGHCDTVWQWPTINVWGVYFFRKRHQCCKQLFVLSFCDHLCC